MGEGVVKVLFTIPIGKGIPVRVAVVEMWAVMLFLIGLAFYLTSNMKLVPTRKQLIAEFIVDSMNKITKNFLGHHWRIFSPYLGTLFLFLLSMNLVGLFGFQPPTSNLNVTASFGVMSILVLIISTIILKNPIRWFLDHFRPIPIIFPFKFLDYFTRTLSLSARLFGNILAGTTIMELIYHGLIKSHIPPVGIPAIASLYFDIFDGVLQAIIFTFLSLIYLYEALEE
ncbi:F0F1 ATP synthase subunit A [Caldicellulosiruptor acetigenus]|uniref:F0F1 ATP synthase subunit A n=1 Tax=Caldicellulosiruptor acetigenus TaxID=301953 RepID=UPI000404EB50|nr:F0F1 ATP synthase subunit A [Caldicellulosiruptor acetigenus]WAM37460.1 F0F1 ATP synthase subunit A [Caldicellulosiruptor acetigenus]